MTAFHKNPGSSELHKKGLFNAIEFPEVGLFTVVLDEKFYCIKCGVLKNIDGSEGLRL